MLGMVTKISTAQWPYDRRNIDGKSLDDSSG
jgi:hypothetical protein